VQARIIWGANLIPVGGRVRRVMISRRGPACSRMPANGGRGRLGRRRARDARAGALGVCGVDVRPPSDSGDCKQKARDGLLRAGLKIFAMMTLCR